MHECKRCGFKTSRLDAFKRHLNRKIPCKDVTLVFEKVNLNPQKVNLNPQKVNLNPQKVTPEVTPDILNPTKKALQCEVCL